MKIGLMRLHNAEHLGGKVTCVLCEKEFRVESVLGIIEPIFEPFWEEVCPACIEYFGKRNPERFATLEEYREAVERYPEPVWANSEEIVRAEHEGTYDETFDASWVSHPPDYVQA
jgi:hypothetical protein